ncbi:MAG: AAA family ATPase [Desulfobacteraceae bacterium]|jgi:general secretion pathway protein A
MYEAFFKLKEKPFNLTPSHRFLYLGESHKEALALLTYGVVERKGFILLTGDVGTGKTTVIQALLNDLGTDVECVHFSNPLLSSREFMDYLASSTFKRRVHFKSKTDFLFEFEEYLREAQQHQRAFILLIDEAQALSFELLEEIRLLSNLEAAEEKLINIFLVGQLELLDRLRDKTCRALYQRIASRYHLKPLDRQDTQEYITTRLRVAGARDPKGIFSKRAIDALYARAEGIPRTINILADNALLLGYSRGKAKITPSMIEESYRDMHVGEEEAGSSKGSRAKMDRAQPQATPGKAGKAPHGSPPRLRKAWIWAFVLVALLGIAVFFWGDEIQAFFQTRLDRVEEPVSSISNKPRIKAARLPASSGSPGNPNRSDGPSLSKEEPVVSNTPPVKEKIPSSAGEGDTSQEPEAAEDEGMPSKGPLRLPPSVVEEEVPPLASGSEISPVGAGSLREALPAMEQAEDVSSGRTKEVIVKQGDYLAKLAMDVYGRADTSILDLIQKHNPGLTNINRIDVGQVIVFPPRSTPPQETIYTVHVASYHPSKAAKDAFQAFLEQGYEVFMVPFRSPEQGLLYRITIGSFQSREEANTYAGELLKETGLTYANVMQLEMKVRSP